MSYSDKLYPRYSYHKVLGKAQYPQSHSLNELTYYQSSKCSLQSYENGGEVIRLNTLSTEMSTFRLTPTPYGMTQVNFVFGVTMITSVHFANLDIRINSL